MDKQHQLATKLNTFLPVERQVSRKDHETVDEFADQVIGAYGAYCEPKTEETRALCNELLKMTKITWGTFRALNG